MEKAAICRLLNFYDKVKGGTFVAQDLVKSKTFTTLASAKSKCYAWKNCGLVSITNERPHGSHVPSIYRFNDAAVLALSSEIAAPPVQLTEAAEELEQAISPFEAAVKIKFEATNAYYQSTIRAAIGMTKDENLRSYLEQICECAP